MATTTLRLYDYLLRPLINGTPGTTDPAMDTLGRSVTGTNVDYMGRPLQVLAFPTTTAVSLGARYKLAGGAVLEVTTAGTTHSAAPTAPGHGLPVTSGTAVLTQLTG